MIVTFINTHESWFPSFELTPFCIQPSTGTSSTPNFGLKESALRQLTLLQQWLACGATSMEKGVVLKKRSNHAYKIGFFTVMWAVRQMPSKIDWNYIGCCTKLYYKTSPCTVVNIPFHDLLVLLRYTCNIEFQEILQNGRKSTKRELDFEKPPAGEDELLYFPEHSNTSCAACESSILRSHHHHGRIVWCYE